MNTYQFLPGTILVCASEGRVVTITPDPAYLNDIAAHALEYYSDLKALETAKSRLTNPNHETGDTALIREAIKTNFIYLTHMASEALEELAQSAEAD